MYFGAKEQEPLWTMLLCSTHIDIPTYFQYLGTYLGIQVLMHQAALKPNVSLTTGTY